jgi:hypothetical protein
MTLHPIPLNFLIYEEYVIFFFISVALALSPVLFWNLCVQSEIWISIVICGLAAVVGQASKAPLSLLTWQLPAAQELHEHLSTPLLPVHSL